jgi:membrane protein DedA with SNARE-associated domain
MLRLLDRLGSTERVERQTERFRQGGARSVAVARSTPGVRIVAIAASALAGIPAIAFVSGLAVGNGLFIAAHYGLGYVVGEPVVNAVGGALGPLAIAAIALAVLGGIGWLTLARIRGQRATNALPSVAAWADACCPACLTLAVVEARTT